MLKRDLYLLLTAESIYVITAQIIDLLFYNYSVFLSLPLALICAWLDYHYFIIVKFFYNKSHNQLYYYEGIEAILIIEGYEYQFYFSLDCIHLHDTYYIEIISFIIYLLKRKNEWMNELIAITYLSRGGDVEGYGFGRYNLIIWL